MRKKPRANAVSQASSASGSAIDSVAQRGVAPIAARSDRFTASDLWPMPAGLSCGEKWRPSSSMSDDTASCMPGVGAKQRAVVAHAQHRAGGGAGEVAGDEVEFHVGER